MIAPLAALLVLAPQAHTNYLVVDHLLIGLIKNGKWVKVGSSNGKPDSNVFNLVTFAAPTKAVNTGGLAYESEGGVGVFVQGEDVPQGVLFSGTPSWPRPVKFISNSNSVYLGILGHFLRSHGVKAKPRLTRAVTVDLDGDGEQEVILEGSSRDNLLDGGMSGSRTGDYSVVLLRYVKNGKAAEVPIQFDAVKGDQMAYLNKLLAVADFDHDGVMEFVVSNDYYEGGGAAVIRFYHGKVTRLVQYGAGV